MGHDGVGLVVRVPEGAEAGLTPFGFAREHAASLGVGTYALFEDEQAFIDLGALTLVIRPVVDALEGAPRPRLDLWRHRWLATSLCLHAMVISMFALRPDWTVLVDTDADYTALEAHLSAGISAPADATEGPRSEAHIEHRAAIERTSEAQGAPRETVRRDASRGRGTAVSLAQGLSTDYFATLARAFQGIGEPLGSPYDPDAIGAVGPAVLAGFPGGGLDMHGTGRGAGGGGAGTISVGSLVGVRGGGSSDDLGIIDCAHGGRCGSVPRIGYTRCGGVIRDDVMIRPCIHHEVMGSLARETVRRVISRHRHEIRFCYERRLASRPGLSGRIALRWVIAPEGRVHSAAIEQSELGDPETERCVEQAVRRWSYPRSDGVTAVQYAFVFQDGEDSP